MRLLLSLIFAVAAILLSWRYFRRYQVTRPPIGVFNLTDIAFMIGGQPDETLFSAVIVAFRLPLVSLIVFPTQTWAPTTVFAVALLELLVNFVELGNVRVDPEYPLMAPVCVVAPAPVKVVFFGSFVAL